MVLIPSEAIIILIILGYKDVRVLLEQCGLVGTISFAIKLLSHSLRLLYTTKDRALVPH
jgi:branched-subunit amino acid transport protein AzlD